MKIFTVLCMLDLITTCIGGLHNEANPIGQIIASEYGLLGLVVVKGLLIGQYVGTIAIFKWMRCPLQKYFEWVVVGSYVLLIAWNVFCILYNF